MAAFPALERVGQYSSLSKISLTKNCTVVDRLLQADTPDIAGDGMVIGALGERFDVEPRERSSQQLEIPTSPSYMGCVDLDAFGRLSVSF